MGAFGKFQARNQRRLLLVFPAYTRSFGTFEHAFPLLGVRAFMPPQGLLLVAALMPEQWEIRFVDENIRPARAQEFEWADAVFISGMHVQRGQILDINRRAHESGRLTVLGGPSVSAAPEWYPEIDILHCGEAGDGTQQLVEYIDRGTHRPDEQVVFRSADRLALIDMPAPKYSLARLPEYLHASIQFSSGCPHGCEFCDIPALYGRRPRFKSPSQVVAELDQIVAAGADTVYFVDDNFIANPNATAELLPHLIQWQRTHNYPLYLACEATLDIGGRPELLELMRQAGFVTIFCGIETPEPKALRQMNKAHNLRMPIYESLRTINEHGIEVAAGIILGLDTDTLETTAAILDFVEQSQIPVLAVNLIYALPKTPLYERLKKAGRIVSEEGRDSNVAFLEPYDVVVQRWLEVVTTIYEPGKLYGRFATQSARTCSRRWSARQRWKSLTWHKCCRAVGVLGRLTWHVGLRSDYAREFWKMVWSEVRRGQLERIFQVGPVAHHLICYARECTQGRMSASNYSEGHRK